MSSHVERATAHVDATRATIDELDHIHQMRPHDRAAIAAGYDKVRQGLKFAEVEALLSIAQEVEALRIELRRQWGHAVDVEQVRLLDGSAVLR